MHHQRVESLSYLCPVRALGVHRLSQLLLKKQAKDRGMPLFTLMLPPCPASLWISSSPPEQNAIATALSNMDSELSVLEARRDKARNLKQAMMQCLLIGRTRFI